MKKIFTLSIALLSMFATMQNVSALVYNVTVPAGTEACYLAGNMNGWSPSANKMTKVDATHYTLELPNALLTDSFKYCSGPDWKYVEKDIAGNDLAKNRGYHDADVVAKWGSLYLTSFEKDVKIDVLVPLATVECYIVGSFANWASPDAAFKMTKVATTADGIDFSITVHTIDTTTLEFKFCAGPAWSYQQTVTANFNYMKDGGVVVVTAFNAIFDPSKTGTINITATVPTGTGKVWIMGDFIGWNWSNLVEGTKNLDGTFSFSIPLVQSIEFKLYNAPDWGHVEVDALGVEVANRKAAYPADANLSVTVIGWKAATGVSNLFDANKYKIYSIGRTIVVEGVTSKIEIIDMSGKLIQSQKLVGKFSSGVLNSGLYIVRVDGATRKVSVN